MKNLNKLAFNVTLFVFLLCFLIVSLLALPWFVPVVTVIVIYFDLRFLLPFYKEWFLSLEADNK